MKRFFLMTMAVVAALTMTGVDAFAGAKVSINDEAKIDIGFRVQSQFFSTEEEVGGNLETVDDFLTRRGRFRLGGSVTDKVGFFLQTDVRSGTDVHLIDAFIKYKLHKMATLIVGQNMAPVLRQNLTSSGGLMAVDRPGIVYKNLTWGARAKTGFTNTTTAGTNAGFFGVSGNGSTVRDQGVTLFGANSVSDTLHYKYYLGAYDGVQLVDGEDNLRLAGRVQVNLFDAESGYYGLSTYLGKKKTVAIGAAFDQQDAVANDGTADADYSQFTVDLFAEYPAGPGSLTFETAYIDLDLDDAGVLVVGNATGQQAQGDGFYAQAGYFIDNWQPWIEFEEWSSDDAADVGSFDAMRVGLNYYIAGHNANVKVGYETTNYDVSIPGTTEDSVDSFVVGFYITY